ncbi:MAG: hypothetical protein VZS44_03430 [Bacilli bacterium]|nr:hypothetical protein [Bacilli bacterium]
MEKKENEKLTTSISSNELKPRTWLLYILILISIGIVFYLSYSAVTYLKGAHDKEKSKWEDIDKEFKNFGEEFDKDSFNMDFEHHTGTESSTSVGWLLDDVITSNKKNKEKLITVVFGSTTTSDPEEIKNLKKQLTKNKYEISVDYDEKGFVNKITIEELE